LAYRGITRDCENIELPADGVRELTLQKRDAPDFIKAMKKEPGSLYQWNRDGDKIRGGKRVF